jgi:hypothetical protein
MSNVKLFWHPVAESDDWDALVDRSPQGTLFSKRAYLKAAGSDYRLYWIKQGAEIKAGVALMVSADGTSCELNDLVIYGGLLFDLDPERQLVNRRNDEFQITEFFIEQIAGIYASIEFQLSPEFGDLRPFLWHRYHDAEQHKFRVDLRYTSYLDISSLSVYQGREEESPCFSNLETIRRRRVREAKKKGGKVIRGNNVDVLIGFYRTLMHRQGSPQSEFKLECMKKIMDELLKVDRGAIYNVLDAEETVIYSIFYGWDAKRAYYLFGAGHPEISEPWQGTFIHWEAFRDLAQNRDIREVDLEGVNSPQRGWFKLGFGGDLRPYYHVHRMEWPSGVDV